MASSLTVVGSEKAEDYYKGLGSCSIDGEAVARRGGRYITSPYTQ